MAKLLIFFILTALTFSLVLMNFAGDYNESQNLDEAQIQANKDNIKIILDNQKSMKEGIESQATKSAGIANNVTDIQETLEQHQKEIIKNREELRLARQGAAIPPQDATVPAQTPFLTLSIEKTEWLVGSTIIFTGTGIPDEIVIINVFKAGSCGQQDICSVWVTVDNNSNFKIEFETSFDDRVGTWKAYVRQGDLRSETITFEVTQ